MTRDDIIRMAREAGLLRSGDGWTEPHRWGATEVERFVALVAAAEREAIIRDLTEMHLYGSTKGIQSATIEDCIRVVRERNESQV